MDRGVLFEILAGTYEEFTVGYECIQNEKELKLRQTIATHSHRASVKTIAVYNGPKHDILVTGGTDETIHIYDLRCRKESGILINHSGTVTCIRFTPDGSHLMSCSEDGSINIYKVGSWFLEKTWPKAHKGLRVNYLAMHPTGKLALSIGADFTLRTWNLIKGRAAYTINLSGKVKRPEMVEWSLCGRYYGVLDEDTLHLYSLDKAGIEYSMKSNSRITDICFLKDERVVLGDWLGSLICYSFKKSVKMWEIKEGDMRQKALSLFEDYLISIDGEGKIFIYDVPEIGNPKKKTVFETSCRITCVAVSKLLSEEERPKKKQKVLPISTDVKKENGDESSSSTPKQKEKPKGVICTPNQQWTVKYEKERPKIKQKALPTEATKKHSGKGSSSTPKQNAKSKGVSCTPQQQWAVE